MTCQGACSDCQDPREKDDAARPDGKLVAGVPGACPCNHPAALGDFGDAVHPSSAISEEAGLD